MDQELKELLLGMRQDITDMKQDLTDVKQRVTKMEIHQENVTDKNIQLLLEGQQGMNEKFQKLDQVAENVEEIKAKVTALEAVTRDNTSQIKELRIAKQKGRCPLWMAWVETKTRSLRNNPLSIESGFYL